MINIKKIFYSILFTIISFIIYYFIFYKIYFSNYIIFYYAIHPFNICNEQPIIWKLIKLFSIIFYIFSNLIIFYFVLNKIFKNKNLNNNIIKNNKEIISNLNLNLIIGFNKNNDLIILPEKSLYQNILITGTIGTGKTSSAMYPFTKQLIEYKSNNSKEKLGMLILDVKGNYHLQVKKYCKNVRKRK